MNHIHIPVSDPTQATSETSSSYRVHDLDVTVTPWGTVKVFASDMNGRARIELQIPFADARALGFALIRAARAENDLTGSPPRLESEASNT